MAPLSRPSLPEDGTRWNSGPLLNRSSRSGAALGGITLGALGIVPILGLVFCLIGAVLSLAALRTLHRQGKPTRLAYLGLGLSLSTSIPGLLLWGWLHSASAAW
jgi:hypothetical protein